MWQDLRTKITRPGAVLGVCLEIDSGGGRNFSLCKLLQNKNVISIDVESLKEVLSFSDLQKFISADTPVALVVQGKGVVTKKVATNNFIDEKASTQMFSELWPTAKAEDFCVQVYTCKEAVFLSIIREDFLNEIFQGIKTIGAKVVSVEIGPFALHHVLPFLKESSKSISIANEAIVIEHEEIVDVKKRIVEDNSNTSKYGVGDDTLSETFLLPYSAALNALFLHQDNPKFASNTVRTAKEEWDQYKIFKVAGSSILGIWLLVLIINFFFFLKFEDKKKLLQQKVSQHTSQLSYLEVLKGKQKEQQDFFKGTGLLHVSNSASLFDKLAATRPSELWLIELTHNPVDSKQSKIDKKFITEKGTLLVKGSCTSSIILNEWLQQLNKEEWVNTIQNPSFKYNQLHKTGLFEFAIILK